MTPKTVLACLTDETGAGAVCGYAARLAGAWNARCVGLHAAEGIVVYPSLRVELPPSVYRGIAARQEALAEGLRTTFEAAAREAGVEAVWRARDSDGDLPADTLAAGARAGDLVVMGTALEGTDLLQRRHAQEAVIRNSGRPVVVVPMDVEARAPRRAVAGWRDTAQAARAIHDLIPLLAEGGALRLVSYGDAGAAMDEMAETVACHGIEVDTARRPGDVPSVVSALQDEAAAFDADILAVGAYGHSRAYDLILGAVSRELLREARLPVLFSR